MKIVVIGCGNIGGVIGTLLHVQHQDSDDFSLTFLQRPESQSTTKLKSNGLAVHLQQEDQTILIPPSNSCRDMFITDPHEAFRTSQLNPNEKLVIMVATKRAANPSIARMLSESLEHLYGDSAATTTTPADDDDGGHHRPSPSIIIVTLQNGVGAAEGLAKDMEKNAGNGTTFLNNVKFISAMVQFNSTKVDVTPDEDKQGNNPGAVTFRVGSDPNLRYVVLDRSKHAEAEDIAKLIDKCEGIRSYADTDFASIAYGKLIMNLANAVNALSGKTIKEMLSEKTYRKVWAKCMEEARRVIIASGIQPRSPRDAEKFKLNYLHIILKFPDWLFNFVVGNRVGAGGKTSMLQDLEAKAEQTEIDFINGEIVRLAEELQIPVPVNKALVQLVKSAEHKHEGSPCISGNELLSLTKIN